MIRRVIDELQKGAPSSQMSANQALRLKGAMLSFAISCSKQGAIKDSLYFSRQVRSYGLLPDPVMLQVRFQMVHVSRGHSHRELVWVLSG